MIGLLMFLLFIATVAMLAVVVWSALQNKRAPELKVPAIVMRHRTRDYGLDAPANPVPTLINVLGTRLPFGKPPIDNKTVARTSGEVTIAETVVYLITFGVQGQEVELVVPEAVYNTLKDGEEGTLVYKGEIYKHFMKQERTQLIAPPQRTQRLLNPDERDGG